MERMENISGPCVSDRIHFEGGGKKKDSSKGFLQIPELFERPRIIITLMMFIRDTRILREDVFGRGFTRHGNLRYPN